MRNKIGKRKEGPTKNSQGLAAGKCPHLASHWRREDAHKGIPCHVETLVPIKKYIYICYIPPQLIQV